MCVSLSETVDIHGCVNRQMFMCEGGFTCH